MQKRYVDLLYTYAIMLPLTVFLFNLMACANRVEVPNTVNQCFKDPKTGECTNQAEVIVRHIISVELPTAFTDTCKSKWNEQDYPDKTIRDVGYNACISEYINNLLTIIKGFNPTTLPTIPQGS